MTGWPTLLMAVLLPTALATSRSLRGRLLVAWAMLVAPAAVALLGLSSGDPAAPTLPASLLALAGAALFVHAALRDHKPVLPLLVLGACACLVAYFSGGRGGPGPMMDWYERFGLTEAQAYALTLAFRKTVHFTFYGTVGLSALLAAHRAGAGRAEAVRTAALAVLVVAGADELRQAGYANRSGSPWDVLLDFAGAAVFVGLSEARRARRR